MVKLIKVKEKKDINLYLIGDMHCGAKTFAKKEFEGLINDIRKNKKARVIMMGDMGDYIEKDDTRRYDKSSVDKKLNTAEKQTAYVISQLSKIQRKVYGILRGNHESAYAKYHRDLYNSKYRDEAEIMSKTLDVPYLEDLGIIKLKIGKHKYNIVVAHGVGASTKLAGQVNALANIINSFEVVPDIAAMGHVHTLQTIINPKMNFNFKTNIKHLALTGNFYRTYVQGNINYASSNLYNPLPIGCVMYELDKKGNIKDNKIIL